MIYSTYCSLIINPTRKSCVWFEVGKRALIIYITDIKKKEWFCIPTNATFDFLKIFPSCTCPHQGQRYRGIERFYTWRNCRVLLHLIETECMFMFSQENEHESWRWNLAKIWTLQFSQNIFNVAISNIQDITAV